MFIGVCESHRQIKKKKKNNITFMRQIIGIVVKNEKKKKSYMYLQDQVLNFHFLNFFFLLISNFF